MTYDEKREMAVAYLDSVVRPLCAEPDSLSIELIANDKGISLTLMTGTKDKPLLIGYHGMTAQSLRQLMCVWGLRHKIRVDISEI